MGVIIYLFFFPFQVYTFKWRSWSTEEHVGNIKERQLGFLGRVIRKNQMEKLILTGREEDTRIKGR